jgi:hypothetical protein
MAEYCSYSGKVMHASPNAALKALRRMVNSGGATGNPYLCSHCGAWHQTKGFLKSETRKAYHRRVRAIKEFDQ